MKKVLIMMGMASIALLVSPIHAGADDVVGSYATTGGKSIVKIYKCGAKYCGRITWLKEPKNKAGTDKLDIHNPNAAKKARKVVGMNLVWGFKHDGGNLWKGGKIYDPNNGKTYYCKLTLNGKKLKVRGSLTSLGWAGKTKYWTKVK